MDTRGAAAALDEIRTAGHLAYGHALKAPAQDCKREPCARLGAVIEWIADLEDARAGRIVTARRLAYRVERLDPSGSWATSSEHRSRLQAEGRALVLWLTDRRPSRVVDRTGRVLFSRPAAAPR